MTSPPAIVKFKKLWDNYADNPTCNSHFSNQCAIKVGAALAKCGVRTTELEAGRRHCWFHDNKGRPSVDRIDLWNGSRISDWPSWIRFQMGIAVPGVWSDFEQSQRILF